MAATLPDATTNKWYQQYISEFTPQQIDYKDITTEQQTRDQLSASEAAYLEPYLQQSMKSVLAQAQAQRASYDADAASRGMTQSTYLTDVKGRVSQQAQSDIAGLQSAYQSTLAQQTNSAYQAQLNRLLSVSQQNEQNRLSVSEWNASERTRAEALAWQRAFVAASQEASAASQEAAAAASSGGGSWGTNPNADGITANDPNYIPYVYTSSPQLYTGIAKAKEKYGLTE